MNGWFLRFALLFLLPLLLAGCEAVEGIFKAGLWVGIVAVVIVVAVVVLVARKVNR